MLLREAKLAHSASPSYICKAWLALQKRLQYQLEGKTRWLEMVKSDAELVKTTGCTLDTLRLKIQTQLVLRQRSNKR